MTESDPFGNRSQDLVSVLQSWLSTRFSGSGVAPDDFRVNPFLGPEHECRVVIGPLLTRESKAAEEDGASGRAIDWCGRFETVYRALMQSASAYERIRKHIDAAYQSDLDDDDWNELADSFDNFRSSLAELLATVAESRAARAPVVVEHPEVRFWQTILRRYAHKHPAYEAWYDTCMQDLDWPQYREHVEHLMECFTYGAAAFHLHQLGVSVVTSANSDWMKLDSEPVEPTHPNAQPSNPTSISRPSDPKMDNGTLRPRAATLDDFPIAKVERVRGALLKARAETTGPFRKDDVYEKAKIRRGDASRILALLLAAERTGNGTGTREDIPEERTEPHG